MSDAELLRAFYQESGEILEKIEESVETLAAAPSNSDAIHALFRGIHTIKGNSSFLSLEKVTRLAHAAESLLDLARNGKVAVTPELIEAIRSVTQDLHCMIVDQDEEVATAASLEALEKLLHPGAAKPAASSVQSASQTSAMPAAASKAPSRVVPFVRVDETKLSKIVALVSELELVRYGLEQLPEKMDRLGREAEDLRFDVDLQVSKLSRLTRSLSGLVFGVRLVPVNQVFQRFPRVVKDLAKKLGKEIELEVMNGEAELDKSIVEAIADPMTHLIRNSADHGIEKPEERVKARKPRVGKVKLNSYVRGNFVFIEISDDGRGIDGDKILKKAVEKGIVPADKADTFTDSKKLALIFAPGFSTAETVTDISGRGVGMDVVKSNINKLKGTVLIESKVGEGTVIRLRFPMSIVVLFSLFVEINRTCCSIAVEQVNESMDYSAADLLPSVPEGAPSGEYLAVYSLRTLLWGEAEAPKARAVYHTLCFKEPSAKNMAFVVDEYSSIEEAIVQSVDSYVAALPGIQGATVRKDGSVGLVLNSESIVEHALKTKPLGYVKVKAKVVEQEANLADFLSMGQAG